MKRENVNYIVVGLFVLAMFALLMMLLYRITGQDVDTEPYYVTYSNITGVRAGTLVTYGGYQVGEVEAVEPVRTGEGTRYRLRLGVRQGWKVPADSVARIVSPGLLSDNIIDIVEGDSARFLSPRDEIQGQEEISMMSLLNSMAYELQQLSEQSIKPLFDNLNRQVEAVGGELATEIPRLSRGANALLDQLNESAASIDALFTEENRQRVTRTLANAEQVSEELVELSGGFGRVRDKLDRLLDNSNSVVTETKPEVRAILVSLRESLDLLSQKIDVIAYNLEAASRNMNEFSRQIRTNPGVLLGGRAPREQGAEQ